MRFLKWLIIAAAAYAGLIALIYVAQRSLMYFPERLRTSPAAAGLPEAHEISLATRDRETVIVWYVPPRGEKPVVLYFPGNGGALRHRVARFRAVIADGNGLIALSYRGYGGSTGTPTEAGLIADAEARICLRLRAVSRGAHRTLGLPSQLRLQPVTRSAASCWKDRSPPLSMWRRARIGSCRFGFS